MRRHKIPLPAATVLRARRLRSELGHASYVTALVGIGEQTAESALHGDLLVPETAERLVAAVDRAWARCHDVTLTCATCGGEQTEPEGAERVCLFCRGKLEEMGGRKLASCERARMRRVS